SRRLILLDRLRDDVDRTRVDPVWEIGVAHVAVVTAIRTRRGCERGVGVVADRDVREPADLELLLPSLLCGSTYRRGSFDHRLRPGGTEEERVGHLDGSLDRARRLPADPDRRQRLLHGRRPQHCLIRRCLLRRAPDAPDLADLPLELLPALRPARAEHLVVGLVPPETEAEVEP